MQDADIAPFFATLRDANPEPASELEYASVFELLVAVMLSAQTTDKRVNQVTRALFASAPTAAKMLALGTDTIEVMIKPVGFFRAKTKNLLATCRILVEEHGGQVPKTREALEALPGVGRKTANVILNNAFGDPTLAVDTHVFRVANRTGLAIGETPLEVELGLLERVPAEFLPNAHHWLILHGRYVCVARRPLCEVCAVARWCDSAPPEFKKRAAPPPA
jgi:endonuclease-3